MFHEKKTENLEEFYYQNKTTKKVQLKSKKNKNFRRKIKLLIGVVTKTQTLRASICSFCCFNDAWSLSAAASATLSLCCSDVNLVFSVCI